MGSGLDVAEPWSGSARGPSPAAAPGRRRGRLAESVSAVLIEAVVSNRMPVGSALPAEGTLADQFAVSRSTVREAVKLLEARGLVEVRQGLGTLVRPSEEWDLLSADVLAAMVRHEQGLAVLDELVELRSSLESMLAAKAAVRASPQDIAEIEDLFRRMEATIVRPHDFIEIDAAFHERIMRAAGSRLVRSIVKTVHDQARSSFLYSGTPTVESCRSANAEHRLVLDRLRDGDSAGAAATIADHITHAWQRRRPGVDDA